VSVPSIQKIQESVEHVEADDIVQEPVIQPEVAVTRPAGGDKAQDILAMIRARQNKPA
jgi:hypothetical protein